MSLDNPQRLCLDCQLARVCFKEQTRTELSDTHVNRTRVSRYRWWHWSPQFKSSMWLQCIVTNRETGFLCFIQHVYTMLTQKAQELTPKSDIAYMQMLHQLFLMLNKASIAVINYQMIYHFHQTFVYISPPSSRIFQSCILQN